MDKDELKRVVRAALLESESRCLDDYEDREAVVENVTNQVFEAMATASVKRRMGVGPRKDTGAGPPVRLLNIIKCFCGKTSAHVEHDTIDDTYKVICWECFRTTESCATLEEARVAWNELH
ncbi:hypothetical protein KKA69_05655 [Patescibacteria group bacterium]|nr:hypothetical protein [Patescibacteria group bacterium]